ncbi:hypothetical protein [Actinoplanes subtropicus]|uniref:hypothetical protein n=1 Tax=Actinoplanes subtropicus TaxID=543632 RepID=UPI0006921445|nr:hypothetical protein [Actinoplanes subtropicus]
MEDFRRSIYDITRQHRPCSVRQVYYLGIGTLWNKDTGGSRRNYNTVVRELGIMRESGMLPWDWLTDATRYVRIALMYDSVEQAIRRTAEEYRRDLWSMQPRRVEVWAESDSISGVVDPVTRALGVGLFSCRGQASKDFAHSAAEQYVAVGKPVTVLYVGDFDPSGLAIPRSLEERLRHYSRGSVPIDFRRCALTVEDVRAGGLVQHEANAADKSYARYAETCQALGLDSTLSTEVEALAPETLRSRLEEQIYALVEDASRWNATLAAERSERDVLLTRWLGAGA